MSTLQKKSEFNLFSFFFQQRVFLTVWQVMSLRSVADQDLPFGFSSVVEVVWTMVGWIGVLVAAIGTVQHIQTRTVPLVRSFKARILPRPLPLLRLPLLEPATATAARVLAADREPVAPL